jgi:hypothetical protein
VKPLVTYKIANTSIPTPNFETFIDEPRNDCLGLVFRLPVRKLVTQMHKTLKVLHKVLKLSSIHGTYSLGVIFLEVGCWKEASGFDFVKQEVAETNDGSQIRKDLIATSKTYQTHRVGRRYCDVVQTCLSESLAPSGSDHNPAQLLTDLLVITS